MRALLRLARDRIIHIHSEGLSVIPVLSCMSTFDFKTRDRKRGGIRGGGLATAKG